MSISIPEDTSSISTTESSNHAALHCSSEDLFLDMGDLQRERGAGRNNEEMIQIRRVIRYTTMFSHLRCSFVNMR